MYSISRGLTRREYASYGLAGGAGWLGLTYVFYKSLIPGAVTIPIFLYFYFHRIGRNVYEKRLRQLRGQFGETIEMLSAALLTGHAIEPAIEEVCRQLGELEGEEAFMVKALRTMVRQIGVGATAEEVWRRFASDNELEEAEEFSRAFSMAKRSGASIPDMMRKVSEQLSLKIQTESQIETMIAGKRLEQSIMNLMPAGILMYVSLTSPDLLTVMYTTTTGRIVMTICLAVYIGAYLLASRLVGR